MRNNSEQKKKQVKGGDGKHAHYAVEDDFPLLLVLIKSLANVLEVREVIQPADLIPRCGGQPGWCVEILKTNAPSEQEVPLIVSHLLVVLEDVHTQQECKQQLYTKK